VPGQISPPLSFGSSSNAGCLKAIALQSSTNGIGIRVDPKGEGNMVRRGGYGIFFGIPTQRWKHGSRSRFPAACSFCRLSPTSAGDSTDAGPAGRQCGYACHGANGGAIPFCPLYGRFPIPNKRHLGLTSAAVNLSVQKTALHFVASVPRPTFEARNAPT